MSRAARTLLVQHCIEALSMIAQDRNINQRLRLPRDGRIDYGQFLLKLTVLRLRIPLVAYVRDGVGIFFKDIMPI